MILVGCCPACACVWPPSPPRRTALQEEERASARGAEPSLLRAILAAYGRPYLSLGVLKLCGDALNFAGPLFLNLLLHHLAAAPAAATPRPRTLWGSLLGWRPGTPAFGYACAAGLVASLLLRALLGAHFGYRQALISSRLRSAVTAAVFRKALAVNAATLAATGSGRVQVRACVWVCMCGWVVVVVWETHG